MNLIAAKRYETSEYLSQQVTPILHPIMERVLLERPENVASFLAKSFGKISGHAVTSPTKKMNEASDENGVEMDTNDSANLSDEDLFALLLPNGTMPGLSHPTISNFSISYNSSLLSGWVKQRSPGCAAASVAGAFNALKDTHRNASTALCMDDVIGVLMDIQRQRAEKQRSRIERFLLGASLEPLDVVLRQYIHQHHDGKTFAGENKATCCGKKARNAALKKIIFMRRTSSNSNSNSNGLSEENDMDESNELHESKYDKKQPTEQKEQDQVVQQQTEAEYVVATTVSGVPKEEWVHRAPVFESIRELIELKEKEEAEKMAEASLASLSAASANVLEEEEDDDEEEEEEGEEEESEKVVGKSSSSKRKNEFSWYKEIKNYFEIVTGLEKLQRKKPSTAAFGNWGIMAAVRECNDNDDTGTFKAFNYMGRGTRGSKVVHRLSPSTRNSVSGLKYEAELERTFQLLKLEHSHPNAVLLSHHKNHYALVYAVRDWVEKVPIVAQGQDGGGAVKDEDEDVALALPTPTRYRKQRIRQVLTARRGQRPSAWIDWEELRGVYLKWIGYRLMSVRYTPYAAVGENGGSGFSVGMHK